MYQAYLLIYGFLAATAALLLEVFSGSFTSLLLPLSAYGTTSIVLAAFFEEGSRWILFRQYYIRYHEKIARSTPFAFGLLYGIGFASLELLLIWFGFKTILLLPLLGILSVHLLSSLFFSYYLFRLTPRVFQHTLSLVLGMTVLHAAYNLFLV